MKYTIVSRRKDHFKMILFVHPLCYSTRFGFKVNPRSGHCRGYCFMTGHHNVAIHKREIKSWIEFFKRETDKYFNRGRQAFDRDVIGN